MFWRFSSKIFCLPLIIWVVSALKSSNFDVHAVKPQFLPKPKTVRGFNLMCMHDVPHLCRQYANQMMMQEQMGSMDNDIIDDDDEDEEDDDDDDDDTLSERNRVPL